MSIHDSVWKFKNSKNTPFNFWLFVIRQFRPFCCLVSSPKICQNVNRTHIVLFCSFWLFCYMSTNTHTPRAQAAIRGATNAHSHTDGSAASLQYIGGVEEKQNKKTKRNVTRMCSPQLIHWIRGHITIRVWVSKSLIAKVGLKLNISIAIETKQTLDPNGKQRDTYGTLCYTCTLILNSTDTSFSLLLSSNP